MVGVKSIAISIVTSVLILMIPYLVALVFDFLFKQMGLVGFSLVSTVTPLYVMTLRLLLITASLGFKVLDIGVNLVISLLNLIPGLYISFTLDTSTFVQSLGDQIDTTVLDYLTAFGILGGGSAGVAGAGPTGDTPNYSRR